MPKNTIISQSYDGGVYVKRQSAFAGGGWKAAHHGFCEEGNTKASAIAEVLKAANGGDGEILKSYTREEWITEGGDPEAFDAA